MGMIEVKYLPSSNVAELQLSAVIQALKQLTHAYRERDDIVQLVDKKSEEVLEIPVATVALLLDILQRLQADEATTLIPGDAELTDSQAADILHVSRSYLLNLLENDEIPHSKTRSLFRLRMDDLMAYKKERDKRTDTALDELVALSQELGLYDL